MSILGFCKERRFLLAFVVLLSSTLLVSGIVPVAASTLVWSASFDSGSWRTYFNIDTTTCGAVDSVSASLSYGGPFSGYYYHTGSACTQNIRAYPQKSLTGMLTNFHVTLMVYVPKVTLTDWVSFITLHLSDDTFITVDSNKQAQVHLWNAVSGITYQSSPIKWPFDQWFSLTIDGYLKPGTNSAHIILYQNGIKIIDYTGSAGNGLLSWVHFGLYTGPRQAAFTVYNDAIQVYQL